MATLTPEDLNALVLDINAEEVKKELLSKYPTKVARKRAKQIAKYPWFAHKKDWQKEIDRLLENGFKLEVESLISKDISYVTEEYTPSRLKSEDWLD